MFADIKEIMSKAVNFSWRKSENIATEAQQKLQNSQSIRGLDSSIL